MYQTIPTSPATDIFAINETSGEIRIKNSRLLRLDRSMQYLVREPFTERSGQEETHKHQTCQWICCTF